MSSRNQSLDVLRGIAVLLVLGAHHNLLGFGWIGVDLFFVLSGFLISGLLLTDLAANGSISLGRFLVRRGFKIYPSYYCFLFVTAGVSPAIRRYLGQAILFGQNYTFLHPLSQTIPGTTIWRHTWSLAVEEHFYVFLPVLIIALNRVRKLHWIPAISIVLIVVCFLLRIFQLRHLTAPSVFLYQSHLRVDALFAGVALGYLWHFHRGIFICCSQWRILGSVGVALIVPAIALPRAYTYSSASLTSLTLTGNLVGFSAITVWAVTRDLRFSGLLSKIGKYSYSIYLWQMPIAVWTEGLPISLAGLIASRLVPHLPHVVLLHRQIMLVILVLPAMLMGFGAALCGSILGGIALAKLIELPMLRLRDRLFPAMTRSRNYSLLVSADRSPATHRAAPSNISI